MSPSHRLSFATTAAALAAFLATGCELLVDTEVAPLPAPPPQENVEAFCRPSSMTPCLLRVGGTLHDASSGAPLSGRRLRFVVGDAAICTSTTNESGRASCVGVVLSPKTIPDSGYSVVFDGDERFPPTRAKGQVFVHPPKP